MARIDALLKRNRHFAATPAREGASIVARYPVYVITGPGPRGFAELIGGDEAALAAKAVADPEQIVRADGELLLSSAVPPPSIMISGHVYDVTTGLVTTILPATPVRASVTPDV